MLRNFVLESANAPGTGSTVNLAGAATGRRSFAQEFASGAAVFYFMDDGSQQEAGAGTFTAGSPNTLTRTTVLWNSSVGRTSPGRLNFAGSVTVYNALPSERALWLSSAGFLGLGTDVPNYRLHIKETGADAFAALDGPAAKNRIVRIQSSGSDRWLLGANGDAETGGNAGSAFVVYRYSDSGVFLDQPFWIARDTGVAAFAHGVSVGNNLYVANGLNVAAGGATISGGLNVSNGLTLSSGAFTISSGGMSVTGLAGFASGVNISNGLHVFSGATTLDAGLTVSGQFTANNAGQVTGGLTVYNALHVASGQAQFDASAKVFNGFNVASGDFTANGNSFMTGYLIVTGQIGGSISGYYMNGAGVGGFSGSYAVNIQALNGGVVGSAFIAGSDGRVKDEIEPITPEQGIAFVYAFDGLTFRKDGAPSAGFVAQQVARAGYGRMLIGVKSDDPRVAESDGIAPAGTRLNLEYDQTHAYHHAALRGALDRIAALEARLAAAGL